MHISTKIVKWKHSFISSGLLQACLLSPNAPSFIAQISANVQLFDDERRFAIAGWMGRVQKAFNLPFLILKVRHPAINKFLGFNFMWLQ